MVSRTLRRLLRLVDGVAGNLRCVAGAVGGYSHTPPSTVEVARNRTRCCYGSRHSVGEGSGRRWNNRPGICYVARYKEDPLCNQVVVDHGANGNNKKNNFKIKFVIALITNLTSSNSKIILMALFTPAFCVVV